MLFRTILQTTEVLLQLQYNRTVIMFISSKIERNKLGKGAVFSEDTLLTTVTRVYVYQLADRSFAIRDILTAACVQFDYQHCEDFGSHRDADENSSLLRYDAVHIGM